MKLFSAIFIIYLAFLAVQPCEDLVARDGFDDHAASVEQTAPQDDCPDSAPDHECSPFCICSCRQMSAMQFDLKAALTPNVKFDRHTISSHVFNNDYSHQFLDTIWQPPKNNPNA